MLRGEGASSPQPEDKGQRGPPWPGFQPHLLWLSLWHLVLQASTPKTGPFAFQGSTQWPLAAAGYSRVRLDLMKLSQREPGWEETDPRKSVWRRPFKGGPPRQEGEGSAHGSSGLNSARARAGG